MHFRIFTIILILAALPIMLLGQTEQGKDVKPFQSFLKDAPISDAPYGEAGLVYDSYEFSKMFQLGVRGGFNVNEKIEVGGALGFKNFNPDFGDGESGLTDLTALGKYNILNGETTVSAGGFVTLPIGKEEIGESKLNFGGFGSARHHLANGIILTGVAGLDFMETKIIDVDINMFTGQIETKEKTEYETSLLISAGALYPVNESLTAVSELTLRTEGDFMLLTAGADYVMPMGAHLRGALGIGLDDGAPDLSIMFSFLKYFK